MKISGVAMPKTMIRTHPQRCPRGGAPGWGSGEGGASEARM